MGADHCVVCFDPLLRLNVRLWTCTQCRQVVHHRCIERWHTVSRATGCPVCRHGAANNDDDMTDPNPDDLWLLFDVMPRYTAIHEPHHVVARIIDSHNVT